jgi:hypothetical protein
MLLKDLKTINKGLIATLVATFITFLADGTFHDGEGKTSCFADLFLGACLIFRLRLGAQRSAKYFNTTSLQLQESGKNDF